MFSGLCATGAQAEHTSAGAHALLSFGITGGGDEVGYLKYADGNNVKLHAGGLVQFGAGGLWQFADLPVATSLTVNYHVDRANAKNASARFQRTPIELLAYYTGAGKWRVGGGARFVTAAKGVVEFEGRSGSSGFTSNTGAVIEAGYGFTPHLWLSVRAVSEKYQEDIPYGKSYDGSHIGVNFVYQF